MTGTYRDVGYASFEIGGGRRSAVLVVDFQAAFTDPRHPLGGLPPIHAAREAFFHGHPCTEMDPRIHDADNFTYCKNAPSMFFQTPLITFLVRQNVDTVIVTGCTTSGCVRATIVDAFSYGFRVLVPGECCGDPDEGQHDSNLQDVGRRYADVTSVGEVAAYLGGLPAG